MNGEQPSGPQPPNLPEVLTRLLTAPKGAIWPTPEDRHRPRPGPQRPRQPSRAVLGVWLRVIFYNLVGFAILATLWQTMQ